MQGLGQILSGAIGGAERSLAGHEVLAPFAADVRAALNLDITAAELLTRTSKAVAETTERRLADAVRYVGAAVAHRLPRHPVALQQLRSTTNTQSSL